MNRLPCETLQPGTLDVVVVGAIGIDTNVYTRAGSIDATVETHFTESLDYVGQSGGFSSRGFARTNGAGDGLAVGFLCGFVLDGYALEDALWRGQIVARYTCTQKASSSHLMTRDMLDAQWHRLEHPRDVR